MDLTAVSPKSSLGNFIKASTVTPVNDLKGVKSPRFVDGEKLLRCKLASLYRLVDLCGWTHGIFNHISARIDGGGHEHFLINPFGMLYHEVTASSLIKVDLKGEVIDQGSTLFGFNRAGFTLHSAIHAARADIKCVIHIHTPAATAVSAMKCGFLPLSEESMICGNVSYHDFQGIFIDENEKQVLANDLGPQNKIMVLHNHGIAVCGETIEEAFYLTFNFMAACEAQVRAISVGLKNIVLPSDEAQVKAQSSGNKEKTGADRSGVVWKKGEIEFEALMRTMDRLGYRTGYDYKLMPVVKKQE